MPTVGTLYADVLPNTSMFGLRLRNQLGSPATTGIAKKAGLLLGGAVALGIGGALYGVGKLVTSSIGAAIEAEKVTAQTKAVLKSTGEAANVSVGHVQDLAVEIMNYSGVSDEAIQTGENLLLTFTRIRNEVGKGNDIFDQATEIIVDMSESLDQDLKSSAIQVGKALNDPILGMTALRRVGVSFTESQVDMVTRLVETGKQMEAQKFILAELNKEFGGSAAATAEPWEILKEQLGNVQEQIGEAFLPMMRRAAKGVSEFVQSKEFQAWLKDAIKWVKEVVKNLESWAHDTWPGVRDSIVNSLRSLQSFWKEWGDEIIAVLTLVAKITGTAFQQLSNASTVFVWGIRKGVEIIGAQWTLLKKITGNLLAFITRAFANFVAFWFGVADKILAGAEFAFGWIPGIGDRVKKFRDDFQEASGKIVGAIRRQADEFDRWGEKSRSNISGVNTEIGKLITNLKGVSAPGTIRAEFVGGDGFGMLGGGSGTAARMAQMAMAAVAGPQAITSGFRPGSITASGNRSYHGDASNPAQDIGGSNLPGVFAWLATHFGNSVRELIYAHTIIQKGVRGYWAPSDHFDHVHVADQGGTFKGPGFVRMGAGYETFAGGLQPARKVSSGGQTIHMDITINADSGDEVARKMEKVFVRMLRRADRLAMS